jgi:hypothetical protein
MNSNYDGPTPKQTQVLRRILAPSQWPGIAAMSRRQAWEIIHDYSLTWPAHPATDRQKQFLMLRGQWREGMTEGHSQYTRLRFDIAFAGINLQITSGKGRNDLRSREGEGETHK